MVVARPAPLQLRAIIDIFNTKSCWYTGVGVEYAGVIMEPRQPDKHHPSDRRLRPRAQTACSRCKQPLGAYTLCPCKVQETNSKKMLAKAFKTEDTGQTAQYQEPSVCSSSNHTITSSDLRPVSEMTRAEFIDTVSDFPIQSNETIYQLSDSESRPSTSRLHIPIGESPKRNVTPAPRTLFPGKSSLVAGFTLVSKSSKNVKNTGSVKPAVKGKGKAKVSGGTKIPVKTIPKDTSASSGDLIYTAEIGPVPSFIPFKGPVKVSVAPAKGSSSLKGTLKSTSQSYGLQKGPKVKQGMSKDFRFVPETQQDSREFSGVTEKVLSVGSVVGSPEGEFSGIAAATPQSVPESSQRSRHICEVCGKVFVSPGKLNQHRFSHTGERPFQCGECSKAFSSKFKLVRHNLIHSSERRFVCTTCQRPFHRRDHLTNHSKIHSAVKLKFVCDRSGCNKEYGSANSARKHSASHAAQDGNLDCVLCGRHFNSTPEVLHHLKVHAGARAVKTPADRKFRCEHCDRKFFTRKDVRRHLVVHTGLRDFVCQICPQKFGRKDHLVRHMKKSHQGGRSKNKKRAPRKVAPRVIEVETPIDEVFKVEPEYISYPPSTSSEVNVEELPEYEMIGGPQVAMIPLYPPPPYPKSDDLQFYSIDPEIQKLFTAQPDNGNYLMHLMDSVDMSANNHNNSILRRVLSEDCLISHDPLEITDGDILLSTNQSQSSLSSTSSVLMSSPNGSTTSVLGPPLELCENIPLDNELLASDNNHTARAVLESFENESDFAPLPRFNQAFPQPPQ